MIRIKELSLSQLSEYIGSREFMLMKNIPITKHRAFSHVNNPKALPDDKVLFLAYENDEFLGYIGALPDELTLDNEKIRVAWISCMWTDSSARKKGIATQLVNRLYEAWEGRLLITNYHPLSKRFFLKTELFTGFKSLQGIRGYLRFNTHGILTDRSAGSFLKSAAFLTDFLLNIPNELRLKVRKKIKTEGVKIEYVSIMDEETNDFIRKKSNFHLTGKTEKDFQWYIDFPWILNSPENDLNRSRYAFSSSIPGFNQLFIKVYDESSGRIRAFMVLTFRGKFLKIPYLYYGPDDPEIIFKIILAHALKSGTAVMDIYNRDLVQYIMNRNNPFIHIRKMEFGTLISKQLLKELGETKKYYFQYGDGDTIFV